MTKNETGAVLAKLASVYPAYFIKLDDTKKADMYKTWCELFAQDSAEAVNTAVNRLINTSKFMPSVAELREAMNTDRERAQAVAAAEAIDLRSSTLAMLERVYGAGEVPDDVLEAMIKNRSEWLQSMEI